MLNPAIKKPSSYGGRHVTANRQRASVALALANAAEAVAFGGGIEIALTRSGDHEVAPTWVQLFPAGPEIKARDGRQWTLPDPQVVVDAFARNQAELPFDIEHSTEKLAPEGHEAPAQGWIKELKVRDDRTVWARVDWNADGAAAVSGKRYRYASPAFAHTKDGQILRVTSAALTTHPALVMPALADEQRGRTSPTKEPNMTQIALATAAAALGLASTASEADVVSAMSTGAQAAKDIRDPAKFVPAADLTAALTRATTAETALATIQKDATDAKATAAVEAALQAKKITPASREHWLSVAHADLEGFNNAMAAMPEIIGRETDTGKKPGGDDADVNGLTPDQKALCAQLNVDEKAFAANLKKESAQ